MKLKKYVYLYSKLLVNYTLKIINAVAAKSGQISASAQGLP